MKESLAAPIIKYIPLGFCPRCGAAIFVIKPTDPDHWCDDVPEPMYSCHCSTLGLLDNESYIK